ncbi:MAG: hypothetical protein ACOCRO_01905 [Halanaerobiales bacterium]
MFNPFRFIRQLFCSHKFEMIPSQDINDELMRVYGGKYTYICIKCKKKVWRYEDE